MAERQAQGARSKAKGKIKDQRLRNQSTVGSGQPIKKIDFKME
jgi:hypothetical protein